MNKHILAIDYGQKFTGLATYKVGSDPYPLTYGRLPYKDDVKLVKDILDMANNEAIEIIVLGIPRLLDGKETTMTQKIKDFGKLLASKWGESESFFYQDETLSSFEAKQRMENSAQFNFKVDMNKIDEVAACIILEDFLKSEA